MDREETLRRAEKLLRQGRLEAAIEEYARVVDEHPADLASLNALGDLYVRAARSDLALPLYHRVAEAYFREGFHSKAAGFYKKVLKFRPRDENALLRLGELCIIQGRRVEARAHLESVVRLREARGDRPGADEVIVRLAEIDPGDLDARVRAARALARMQGVGAAATLRLLAAELERLGRVADAVALLREVVRLDAADRETLERVVRASLEQGDIDYARAAVSRAADDSPALLALLAEVELADGRRAQAREAVEAWLARAPDAKTAIVGLARRWAERDPDGAYACLGVVIDRLVKAGRFDEAAATLEEYVGTRPLDLTALRRLVEVCEEGRFAQRLGRARAALADGYLAVGHGAEARAVTETLLALEPDEPAHRARLARAAEMLAEQGAALATEEWTQTLSTVAWLDERETSPAEPDEPRAPSDVRQGATSVHLTPSRDLDADSGLPDLDDLFGGLPDEESAGAGGREGGGARSPERAPDAAPSPGEAEAGIGGSTGAAEDLDGLFARLHDQSRAPGREPAAQLLSAGETYVAAGLTDEARPLLEAAAQEPECRFRAAHLLARLHLRAGQLASAITWLERAVESPGLDDAQRLPVLRELGVHLETAREFARALAVWLEVQSLVPGDAEVEGIVARLSHLDSANSSGGESFTP